jgi:hypothetical protein
MAFSDLDIESGLCNLWNYGCQVWHGSEIALFCGVPGQSRTRALGMCMISLGLLMQALKIRE